MKAIGLDRPTRGLAGLHRTTTANGTIQVTGKEIAGVLNTTTTRTTTETMTGATTNTVSTTTTINSARQSYESASDYLRDRSAAVIISRASGAARINSEPGNRAGDATVP
jgi:hypothetical protein